jgi:muconate cycloisomerase
MKIRSIEVFPTVVPFARTFAVASGTVGSSEGGGPVVFVRVESDDGTVGWGEQRVVPSWSYETIESVTSTIRNHFAPILVGRDPFGIHAIHRDLDRALSPSVSNGMPFARAAVDVALHDLCGHIAGLPIHALLGGKIRDQVELCWALSVGSVDEVAAAAREWSDCGCFKVKVAGEPEEDAKRLHAVYEAAPDMPLWLDANQSYTATPLTRLFQLIADIPTIRCVEQPTRSTDWLSLERIREKSPLPVAIDEGCFSPEDVARVARMNVADQVVVKVCKAGGLRRARDVAEHARLSGMEVLGSGLTDCGVAFAAAIHLFSTVELALPSELNGPQFLADMLVEGLEIEHGVATVPDGPGLGVTVKEDVIRELVIDF